MRLSMYRCDYCRTNIGLYKLPLIMCRDYCNNVLVLCDECEYEFEKTVSTYLRTIWLVKYYLAKQIDIDVSNRVILMFMHHEYNV